MPTPELARAIRVTAGVTQADVAAELGVHRVSVARWELGRRRPRGTVLDRYTKLLDELEAAARG
jgi:transcriptional regulator with XRE-family HTH domain